MFFSLGDDVVGLWSKYTFSLANLVRRVDEFDPQFVDGRVIDLKSP